MDKITAKSPGKIILFGEHAVVYGKPAIAMAIDLGSRCQIRQIPEKKIKIKLFSNQNFLEYNTLDDLKLHFPLEYSPIETGLELFTQNSYIVIEKIEIVLSTELLFGAGLGSSASISAALIWALNLFYANPLTKNQINEIIFKMEKKVHKNPSGIDNLTCVYGGCVYFHHNEIEKFLNFTNNTFLIVYSGKPHNTGNAIQNIKQMELHNSSKVREIFDMIENITNDGMEAIKGANMSLIGSLMMKNQQYLSQLGVSTPELDHIIEIAIKNGAYGAKLTGAGQGGCVIILISPEKLEFLSTLFRKKGYTNFTVKLNTVGVECE